MWIIIIILVVIIIATNIPRYKYSNKSKKGSGKPQTGHTIAVKSETPVESKDYTHCYQKRYLLTKNEYQAFKNLKAILDKYQMIACPKVRLLDIVEPINGDTYKGAMGKIQSKHVDFVICDKDLYVKGILELDDNSHNLPDRQERDLFVDTVLKNVGYKVVRVKAITEETIAELLPKTEQ